MALRVEWAAYGRPAAERLRRLVSEAKAGEPLEPVTVVVPSNYVGVATRRLLAGGALGRICAKGTGIAAVTFLTPYRLAELLGAARLAGAGRRPVSTPVIAAALRAVLAEAPGVFGPVAAHPATETALVGAYRELRDCSDAALDQLAGAGVRAGDVVRISRAARARLERNWYDEEDLIDAAVDALADGGDVLGLGAVIAYLPQRLSRHETKLLAATAETLGLAVVASTTGDVRADAEVAEAVAALAQRCGTALKPSDGERPTVVEGGRTRFVTASDADDEVRAAVRAIVDAARAGTPLDRIAVLYASPEPYARLVHEQLAAAGVATNGAAVVPVAGRVAGRTLLGLLSLPEGGFRRRDVFAWLSAAPLLHHGRFAPVTAWERLSREAGVVAGVEQWDRLLATLADQRDAAADQADADPDAPPWKAERAREEAARARSLREFVLDVAGSLEGAAATLRRWGGHATWAAGLLRDLLGGAGRRDDWPPAERRGAERVELALARLGALDGVEGPVPLPVFTRTLALELENDLGRVGRFGEGVLVGSVGMGLALDLDLVVVLGLAEGLFPSRPRDDALLPDDERRAAGGELPLRRAGVDRQHRQLLAALAGARSQLLCLPRGDLRRSAERVPSRFALALASALAGGPVTSEELLAARLDGADHVASFDAGLRRLDVPATAQEHRLRDLLAGGLPAQPADPVLAAGAAVVAARRSHRFSRFDGNLAGLSIPSPVGTVTSPTRLEHWAGCPLAYLLTEVLRVAPVENPEEALEITYIDWGELVHAALERFLDEVLARPPAARPAPTQRWTAADRARLLEIGGEVWAEYRDTGRAGRPIFWPRDRARLAADLNRFLDLDDENRAAHGLRPVAVELAFGFSWSDLDAVPLPLPDGREVRFRGKADRVDRGDDGRIHIVDYKTGSLRKYADITEDDPSPRGRRLQLAVYGVAGRLHHAEPDAPVLAEYWFVSKAGQFKRIGYPLTDEVLAKVGVVLGTIVAGIEAGAFPAHPSDAASSNQYVECAVCDPDGLGVADLRRAWDPKRADPALAPYADLAEPLEGVEAEEETLGEADDA
jgi:ATP-dependent helicase/nuclease subunit B